MTETKSHTLDVSPTDPSESWQTIPAQKQIRAEKRTSINDTQPKFEYPTGSSVTLILTSVTLAYFLFFLDLAVISTATPAITSQFDSLVDVGW
jgi:hypothetical protein